MITLTENKIIVKEGLKGEAYPINDTSKLSPEERFHFNFLKRNFPITETRLSVESPDYLDSLTRVYPKLLDPDYYRKLFVKSAVFGKEQFQYYTKKIPI